MKIVSQNTTALSSATAPGNNQPQLVATPVPDEQRISFWPQHFGLIPQWVTLEPRVFGWMDRLCEDYCGGIWNLYTLNNGGAFMAPEPDDDDDETWVLFNVMNGNRENITIRLDDHIRSVQGKECYEDEMFSIRYFKKGSAHIRFRKPELVDRLNDIIAKHYPGVLPS